jgi:aspartyl aminopeptidase
MADLIQSLLHYLDASPTPFHAVAESARRLREAGFSELREGDAWALSAGSRAYAIRNGTSLVAFICGQKPAQDGGFLGVGAHTDSPNLRVKPAPDLTRSGYRQLGVEVYGGVLLSTWLDRDLSLAGRVLIDRETDVPSAELIDFTRPLLRIPNLAIHLNRGVNTDGLVLNAQAHLAPILGLAHGADPVSMRGLLAQQLSLRGQRFDAEQILGWDLCLYDTQRAALSGLDDEFVQSARLDNLASCFGALTALTQARAAHDATRVIVLYDHEEVGSRSAQGAYSPFLRQALERISQARGGEGPQDFARAMSKSFLISADMAHAIHPNYADRHEPAHAPVLGGGPVLKINANQSYATDGAGSARFAQLCKQADVSTQHYVVRSDLPCGSTIGPITAAELGLSTVDIGSPLLSMHSIREMAAAADVLSLAKLLDTFFD